MSRLMAGAGKVAVAAVLATFVVGCASSRRLHNENAQLKDQVKRLSDTISANDAEMQRLRDRNADLEGQLSSAEATVAEKDTALEDMRQKLAAKGFDVSVTSGTVVVTLPVQILYASGSAALTASGKDKLNSLASELKGEFSDYKVEIQGHTDTDPIRKTKDKYKSNWELSYDRAQTVAYYLMESAGITSERVHVSAYGQHAPVASNATNDGKAKNRRVEIVVMRSAQ